MVKDVTANTDSVDALRPAPDFSPLALEHLHSSCIAVRELIRQAVNTREAADLSALQRALADIQHTLVLLERHGAALVASELRRLTDAMLAKQVEDLDACLHTLVLAGESLADYVAHLQKPGAVDSTLPLLPVINNCRACRAEPLLSEMLVLASGISLPDASGYPIPGAVDITTFVQRVRESRHAMMSGLVGWFRDDGQLPESLMQLSTLFASLADACNTPTRLQPLVPLFESAEFICRSLLNNALDNSAALQRLFAQLERLLDSFSKLTEEDVAALNNPVPETLFLNLLYYVALSTQSTPKAVALRRRFRLDRFIPRSIEAERSNLTYGGVGDGLATSIRESIDTEINFVRQWLIEDSSEDQLSASGERTVAVNEYSKEQPAARIKNDLAGSGKEHAVLDRLQQLEPAILLLGATESMRHLCAVNAGLQSRLKLDIDSEHALFSREQIAVNLVRLERALDAELSTYKNTTGSTQRQQNDNVLHACLNEAQQKLLKIEEELVVLFPDPSGRISREKERLDVDRDVSLNHVLDKIDIVNHALQILPLPEVSPLLVGVQNFVVQQAGQPLNKSKRRDLATVMVSLGYYLNSVMHPRDAAGQLLLEAEMALTRLEQKESHLLDDTLSDRTQVLSNLFDLTTRLNAPVFDTHNALDATQLDRTQHDQKNALVDSIIHQLPDIYTSIAQLESSETQAMQRAQVMLSDVYESVQKLADPCDAVDVSKLTQANLQLLGLLDVAVINNDIKPEALQVLHESAAVLPQLANQLQNSTDKVRGLDELLSEIWLVCDDIKASQETVVNESGTLDGDNTLLDETLPEEQVMTLDNTLANVFVRECEQHIETLRLLVERTVQNVTADIDLPDKDMLRALHTLTGSAQTVEANSIIAIAQPLQKVVLLKQRAGEKFELVDIQIIQRLVGVLESRLEYWQRNDADKKKSPHDLQAEQDLTHLLERAKQDMPAALEPGTWPAAKQASASVQEVFRDEGRELIDAMRLDSQLLLSIDEQEPIVHRLLARLHTLKGGARMAGQSLLAERAHLLEEEIQKSSSREMDATVQFGLADLQKLMLLAGDKGLLDDGLFDDGLFDDGLFDDTSTDAKQDRLVQTISLEGEKTPGVLAPGNKVGDSAVKEFPDSVEPSGAVQAIDSADQLEELNDSTLPLSALAQFEPRITEAIPADTDTSSLLPQTLSESNDMAGINPVTEQAAPKTPVSMGLTESAFEQMLSLSTTAACSQARLGETLQRLRDAYKDLESTSARLQSLPSERLALDSAAVGEMLSDLQNAQRSLADAMLDAETEQVQSARADSALQQALIRAQLVPFAECSVRLGHAVSDAATETDKQVKFEIQGGEISLERSLFRQLLSPLEHLLRNAVVHGVETPAARVASGKSMQGLVSLQLQIDGTDLLISISDDGAGIDTAAVKEKLFGLGFDNTHSADALLHVLSQSGFSTLNQANHLAGRGLGLSAVQAFVDEHNGTLHMRTGSGDGVLFTMRIPQKIRVHQVVLVQSHSSLYAIPVNFVHSVIEDARFSALENYQYDGHEYRAIRLGDLLGHTGENARPCVHSVLVGAGDLRIALCVEQVIGYREIIAQPLGDQLTRLKRFTGGSVLADGRPALIPDLQRLLESTDFQVRHDSTSAQQRQRSLPVQQQIQRPQHQTTRHSTCLVVDDSITLRVAAEQMMLELGFVPTLARDGAEALELTRNELPDVLLVDIDMPQMNGFDFLRHVQLHHGQHDAAIIMISTRDFEEDRREAILLGAGAYLTKPYSRQQLQQALQKLGVADGSAVYSEPSSS